MDMDVSKSDVEFLLDLFKHIPPSHVALFLRLIRLYPMNIVNDSMKREQNILAIINETITTDYKADIWPKIMSTNRIPELVEQVLLSNEDEHLVAAIAKLKLMFELQPHRFTIHQLLHMSQSIRHGLGFEICCYLFFMTDLTMIQIPDIIQRLFHDLYYEVNTIFFYELFVKFWSQHNPAQSCRCQPNDQCMLNFVFDTYLKAHRLVCEHTSSCDESIVKLGAVAMGCPRMPLRSSSVLLKNMTTLELDQLAEEFDDNDISTVNRDNDDTKHKRRIAGFMAVVSNCNAIIGWGESVRSEGMRRWIYQLLKILHLGGKLSPDAAYGSACTFIAYLRNQYGLSIQSSSYVAELMHKKYCIDPLHRRNHVRPECKTISSCEYEQNKPYFDNHNSQVCEQLFSHFTKIKSTLRSITWPYSNIFYCIIFHLRNCFHTKIYPDNLHLAKKSNIEPPINTLYPWTQVMASSVGIPLENET
ncbi:unnamed protein product [Rotaria magnacalcarata]|uniref:Uncharacterized protein n=1 Tax=Rotaria magnacalcarata TaxID=392030 RepID=A0A816YJP0_9BILA|nr:unnamed protein product [Rotaria magnacalcarata]